MAQGVSAEREVPGALEGLAACAVLEDPFCSGRSVLPQWNCPVRAIAPAMENAITAMEVAAFVQKLGLASTVAYPRSRARPRTRRSLALATAVAMVSTDRAHAPQPGPGSTVQPLRFPAPLKSMANRAAGMGPAITSSVGATATLPGQAWTAPLGTCHVPMAAVTTASVTATRAVASATRRGPDLPARFRSCPAQMTAAGMAPAASSRASATAKQALATSIVVALTGPVR